ncbi:MAG: ABC transporter permease [Hyphomicrobiales bacterium]|nr:MAG: ABC transporter permease [Hyphomicrobiales bacterium]
MASSAPSPATESEARAERARVKHNWLLSLPAVLFLLVGASGPLLIVLVYSFLEPGEYSGVIWKPSFDAWFNIIFTVDIFDETVRLADAHLSIFWRSVKLSLLTTLITFVFGLPTAYFIATRTPAKRAFWLFLITIPFWTNLLVRTFAIMEVIRNEGILNTWAMRFGLIDTPIQLLYTDTAVLIGMAYVYLPLMVLPLYASLERLDFTLVEAAYDLYANRWRVLRRVILPLIKPGIVAGSILVFVPSLGAYVTPRVLGGGKNMMIGNFIELQFGQGRNWPLGSSLSMMLLVVVAIALLVYVRAATKDSADG